MLTPRVIVSRLVRLKSMIQTESELQALLTLAHKKYEKGLNARAFFKTSSHSESEDLVQATFTKTWMYLVKGGKIELMRAFLYHVLNGLIIDHYRRHTNVSLDQLLEKGFEPQEANSDTEKLFDIFDGKIAVLLIMRLPSKYRRVLYMRYLQGLSIAEIAKITHQTRNTTTVQLHRGVAKLRYLYNYIAT
jgi:RNA polymerase sigma factor (sigma-70 family)